MANKLITFIMFLRKGRIPGVGPSYMQITVAVTVMEGRNPRNPNCFMKLQKLKNNNNNKISKS